MTTNIYNTHFLPNSSSRTRMWTIFYLQPPAYLKGEFLPQARCRIKSIPFGKYRRYSITFGYYNDLLMMYKLKSKLIPNERPSRNMMYKLKNNIVRVDASSKLIPNERPSRNNNEQALRIPSCKTTVWKDLFYPRTIKEWNTLPNYCFCPESWILQGSAPSLILNDTVFTCTVYKFHFIASKYVQVFMGTPKKWQNSQPVDGGH